MSVIVKYGRALLAGLILLLVIPDPSRAASGLNVQPDVVNISSFFSGAQMRMVAEVPVGCQAVLLVRGKRIESELMLKSHRWELWLNSGEVDIGNTPGLYIALSSDPDLLAHGTGEYPWGYDALEEEAHFSGRLDQSEDATIFREFVELKERDHLYHLYPGGLTIGQSNDGQRRAQADVHLPSRIKPGDYALVLWIVRDGRVIERRNGSFKVQRAGLPQFLYSLAMEHGTLYGFLAVAIAMVVGMFTGFVFHRRDGGH